MKCHSFAVMTLILTTMIASPSTASAQEAVWKSYMDAGEKSFNQGDFVGAEKFFVLAEKEADAFPPDDSRRAYTWNQLAAACERLYQYGRAEQLRKKTVALTASGKNQGLIAHQDTVLANHYRLREKYDIAEPLLKKALVIREKVNGPDAWETAQLIRDLADVNRELGRFDEAEALYKRALKILEAHKNREYHVAFCLANLGELRLRQGKPEEAEALCRQAAGYYEKVKGTLHLNLALCFGTIGESLHQQKKLTESADAFSKALSHAEAGHALTPRTLHILVSAAKLYREQGKTAEAQKLEEQATAIRDQHTKGNATN